MPTVYSTYEAKAKLSEILRKVRRGGTVVISHRGDPVAEVRPIAPAAGLEARVQELTERGLVIRRAGARLDLRPVAKRPGALERFLAERGE